MNRIFYVSIGYWLNPKLLTEIIPSINAPTFVEVRERIALVEPFVSWCHLDVTDGVFSRHPTWHNPRDLPGLQTKLKCEVHLMIERPEEVIDQWLVEPIRRVIAHLEAAKDPELIIKKCRDAGKEIGFAINPETSWEVFKPWFGRVDLILPLGVSPGASGQQANWDDILDKIGDIHKACPACIIEADGGVTSAVVSQAAGAGAQLFVAGSAIFDASDIQEAIAKLRESLAAYAL